MSTCYFRSHLAPRLQAFFDMRCALGRNAEFQIKILTYMDRFFVENLKPGQSITRSVVENWIQSIKTLSTGTRINRTSIFRQFCKYMYHFDPGTCLVHGNFCPKRTRPAPYIYTQKQVLALMSDAKQIGRKGSLRPEVMFTLIGLLYATGLRIGEALRLTLADVNIKKRLLIINKSKFKKSRNVPLSRSVVRALKAYLDRRQNLGYSMDPSARVFLTEKGRPYGHPTIVTVFLEIARRAGIRGPKGQPGPRIHDFRHSFAVHRLAAWYREGAVMSAKLPLLSTYLGHSTITGTEVYLQATAELLEEAGKRFRNHCALPVRNGEARYDA